MIIKLGDQQVQLPPGYDVRWLDDLRPVYRLYHVCGEEVTSWLAWHLDQPDDLRKLIWEAMKAHDEDHRARVTTMKHHQRHDFKAGATSSVCECGAGRDDIVHTMRAFTNDERQKMRDRIGADLIECGECGDLVDAETTSRVMKTHKGQYRNTRLCQLCIVPPAKRNPYTVLAVRLARGTITEDQYETALEDLVRAQKEEEARGS